MVELSALFDKMCVYFTLPISKSPSYISINIENIYDIDWYLRPELTEIHSKIG